jgi:hypothetical protein
MGFILAADIDHVGLAMLVEMGKFFQVPPPSAFSSLL